MRVDSKYKLECATTKDKGRPVLMLLKVDTLNDKPVLIATDGRLMAIVPCEVRDNEQGKIFSPVSLVAARKLAKRNQSAEVVLQNGTATLIDGSSTPTPTDMEYPNWKAVQPDPKRKIRVTVALNAAFLARLAAALGNEEVILSIEDELSAIVRARRFRAIKMLWVSLCRAV